MAGDFFVDKSIATILGAIGMSILLVTWKMRSGRLEPIAPIGWLLTGFYFFNEIPTVYTLTGASLIVISSAIIFIREHQLKKPITLPRQQ